MLMTNPVPAPGEVIADYKILERVGGNMGLVFRALQLLLDKVVALKLVPADQLADPARLARFQREMRVLGQLEHPNLVTGTDARRVGEWHLVSMEWIDGVDLQHLVRFHGPLPVTAVAEVARQAAQGLQYAHEHGLIHRDIKPSNLMLTRTGTVKIIDMGLALAREDSTAQLTQEGLALGTMSYCAPEQCRDASHVDIRADIYSLGCTLYHLLTGKAPYSGRAMTEVIEAHLHEPFPHVAEVRPDVPAELDAVLARMTAKDPKARFSTPREVVEALEPFARGANLASLVPPPVPSSPTPAPAGEVIFASGRRAGPRRVPWPNARPVLLAVLLVMGLVIAGVILFTLHVPIVVMMDTTAPDGVYDADNKTAGGSNAKEVYKVLVPDNFLPPDSLHAEPLFGDWNREDYVCSLHPDLVIVHRSAFFHSYNAEFRFGLPPDFEHPADDPRWRTLYRLGDDRLITLMGMVGNQVPHTRFLIYSRGTDTNWLDAAYRAEWVGRIEVRFKKLKGCIDTMVIPNGYKGTFRDPATADELRARVRTILGLPEKREPNRRILLKETNALGPPDDTVEDRRSIGTSTLARSSEIASTNGAARR